MTYEDAAAILSYDPETGVLRYRKAGGRWNRLPAGRPAGTPDARGYLVVNLPGVGQFKVHRICWLLAYGAWPSDTIDHINRDPADNRLVNLRAVPQAVNAANRGEAGVTWDASRARWKAQLKRGYRHVFNKRFVCFGQAVKARNEAKRAADE